MLFINIINFLGAAFLGYLVGRFGDNYVNFWIKDPGWMPHHWIFGLLLAIIGLFYKETNLGLWLISFGLGVFISDLKDFYEMKFFSPDGKEQCKTKFWHID